MRIRKAITVPCFFLLGAFLFSGLAASALASPLQQPNIILINLDDADTEMFSRDNLAVRFPNLNQLSNRSVRFTNAHATTPLCGPSRACLLRAQYAHHCGIRVNEPGVPAAYGFDGGMRSYIDRGHMSNDLSTWMQDAGYHTMHIGKFLHHDHVFMIPEGWDDFYSSLGGKYYNTHRITNRNGDFPQPETLPDGVYRTNAEADDAVALINRRANSDDGKPFFLFLNPFGPHAQQANARSMIDAKYESLWPNIRMPESESYDEEDVSDLVGPIRHAAPLAEGTHARLARHYRERMVAVKSVDDMVGDIMRTLRQRGLEENTYVFVTSDNGYSLGHHRVIAKGFAIDRATNVPLLVAGPGVNPGETDHLLAHIDIGPTIVRLAGGTVPDFVDGVSFAGLIANPSNPIGVRDSVLIENFETRTMFGQRWQFASTGLRLKNAIYTEWASGGREYFNLKRDPDQLKNIYNGIPVQARRSFANRLRKSKSWSPSNASFLDPYHDLDTLQHPHILQGITESSVSTRNVRLAIRDLTTGKYWDGETWVSSFRQVPAELGQPNGMLSTWQYPLDFGDQKPVGLIKTWVWGIDWSGVYDAPDTVTYTLGERESAVTLQSPEYTQRFSGPAILSGVAINGDDVSLNKVELRIHDISNNEYWTGSGFRRGNFFLPVERDGDSWSHVASLPPGSYRVSVNGVDADNNRFDVTHRLFHVDP